MAWASISAWQTPAASTAIKMTSGRVVAEFGFLSPSPRPSPPSTRQGKKPKCRVDKRSTSTQFKLRQVDALRLSTLPLAIATSFCPPLPRHPVALMKHRGIEGNHRLNPRLRFTSSRLLVFAERLRTSAPRPPPTHSGFRPDRPSESSPENRNAGESDGACRCLRRP